jgi:hypothetical protein
MSFEEENGQGMNEGMLPENPKNEVDVIQYKYYEILTQHEQLLCGHLSQRYDFKLARQLLTSIYTFMQLTKHYKKIKKDKELMKTYQFIEKFARTRYISKNRDIKPQVLFDTVNDITKAYNKLGINTIDSENE